MMMMMWQRIEEVERCVEAMNRCEHQMKSKMETVAEVGMKQAVTKCQTVDAKIVMPMRLHR